MTIDRPRIKKIAIKRVIRNDVLPCRKCGNKNYLWDFLKMIKTCKSCNDESGVM